MGVKYSDTIERMRWAGKLKNDSAVARVLGVTPQALSNYKKRGELPSDLVIRFAGIYNLSLDWLINGDGDVYRTGYEPPENEHGIPMMHEGVAIYGSMASKRRTNKILLTREEIICIGKLIIVLGSTNKSVVKVLKLNIDALYIAISQSENEEAIEALTEEVC